jgi:hypothetical protein
MIPNLIKDGTITIGKTKPGTFNRELERAPSDWVQQSLCIKVKFQFSQSYKSDNGQVQPSLNTSESKCKNSCMESHQK